MMSELHSPAAKKAVSHVLHGRESEQLWGRGGKVADAGEG